MKNHYAPGTVAGPYKSSSDDSGAFERGHSLIDRVFKVAMYGVIVAIASAIAGYWLAALGVI